MCWRPVFYILLTAIGENHQEIRECQAEIKLVKKIRKNDKSECFMEESDLPALPVTTFEELEKLEEILKKDDNRKSLVLKLSTYGGVPLPLHNQQYHE